jgi:alkylmercury lyase
VAAPSALVPGDPQAGLDYRVPVAAFRALLVRRRPVSSRALAAELGVGIGAVREALDGLVRADRIRLDEAGRVVGACGLSLVPSRHELAIGRRRYWTWCALDAVGILGALGTDGGARSRDPVSGAPLDVRFRAGAPVGDGVVVFLADESCCPAGVDSWCPKVNFFRDAAAARTWAERNGVPGEVVDVREATRRGAARWRPLVEGPPVGPVSRPEGGADSPARDRRA